jgi:hypothetical protein
MRDLNTSNSKAHAQNIQSGMQEISDHLRKDINKVEDTRAKALFETSAEVLNGLIKAFSDYQQENEAAWK